MPKITFFPGMPMLTFSVKSQLKQHLPLAELYLEEEPKTVLKYGTDIKAYEVFVDEHRVGKFAIRRNGNLIERNFFCILPVKTTLPFNAIKQGSFGVACPVYYDPIRILWEHIKVAIVIRFAPDATLTKLNLTSQELMKFPSKISQLTDLTVLRLRNNRLRDLPPEISKLTKLTTLNLENNQLVKVPQEIGHLTSLIILNLANNQLVELPSKIGQLTNLTFLDLYLNRLTKLPPKIGQLTTLKRLNICFNSLYELPPEIGGLANLKYLDLTRNSLKNLPPEIGQLTNLKYLDLSKNQLTELPPEIGQLTNLTYLDLSKNQLKELPLEIGRLTMLTKLTLDGNPLEQPPPEVVARGVEAIKGYLKQLEWAGKDYLYEAKLLIVGESGAGKTTLANKIVNPNYELRYDQPSTEGIDVIHWNFRISNNQLFWVNIWDFGGQEIYHATHQFFLTKRSLYALVVDTCEENIDLYYWLSAVKVLSDNSPVLIIKNEKQDRQRQIGERQLRGQFTNLKETLATNLATNRGLPEILTNIKHYICNLPHIGIVLPQTWIKVRQTLENDSRYYISLDEYLNICEQNGFETLRDKLQLSGYLHDLGVCLHFQNDPLLKKTVVLKPSWGTDAVYKVLDNEYVKKNYGQFTRADLVNIWYENEYANMHDELLSLMINFQLCYQIPGSNDTYIAPQLLDENQPVYDWEQTNNLILRYVYTQEFMPKGILTRFIVLMHPYIMGQRYVWRSGVILEKDETQAEAIEYYSKREIKIRITGKYKKALLTIITYELDKIHDSFKRLDYSKLVPCNCMTCKASPDPHNYPFDMLQDFVSNGQYEIQCKNKPYQMVNILQLIDDVVGKDQFIEVAKEGAYMISILFLAADPTDASRLRLGEEYREIQEKLKLAKRRDYFRMELPQLSVRTADISQALLDVEPQIVHFSGHGTSNGALCFENQVGQTHLVQPDALAALFEEFANQVECVVLNACHSKTQAKAIAKHIEYVIGMNQAIGDKAAIAFAVGFYQALGAGRSIEEAYKFGCVQIRLQGIPEHLTPVLIKKEHA